MAEIIKTYKQSIGASRFIGKRYTNADRIDGHFGAKWGEWHKSGWFEIIKDQFKCELIKVISESPTNGTTHLVKVDGKEIEMIDAHSGAIIGLMREDGGFETFEYWIGAFMPENTPVPDGFTFIDFPASSLGVCWIYGKVEEVFMREEECVERLEKDGFNVNTEWCFERYVCPRFTKPDDKGNVTLDICFFLR